MNWRDEAIEAGARALRLSGSAAGKTTVRTVLDAVEPIIRADATCVRCGRELEVDDPIEAEVLERLRAQVKLLRSYALPGMSAMEFVYRGDVLALLDGEPGVVGLDLSKYGSTEPTFHAVGVRIIPDGESDG